MRWNGLVSFIFRFMTLTQCILDWFFLRIFNSGLVLILAPLNIVNFTFISVFVPFSLMFELFVVLSSLHHIFKINLQFFLSLVFNSWIWRLMPIYRTIWWSFPKNFAVMIVLVELVNSWSVELPDDWRLN